VEEDDSKNTPQDTGEEAQTTSAGDKPVDENDLENEEVAPPPMQRPCDPAFERFSRVISNRYFWMCAGMAVAAGGVLPANSTALALTFRNEIIPTHMSQSSLLFSCISIVIVFAIFAVACIVETKQKLLSRISNLRSYQIAISLLLLMDALSLVLDLSLFLLRRYGLNFLDANAFIYNLFYSIMGVCHSLSLVTFAVAGGCSLVLASNSVPVRSRATALGIVVFLAYAFSLPHTILQILNTISGAIARNRMTTLSERWSYSIAAVFFRLSGLCISLIIPWPVVQRVRLQVVGETPETLSKRNDNAVLIVQAWMVCTVGLFCLVIVQMLI